MRYKFILSYVKNNIQYTFKNTTMRWNEKVAFLSVVHLRYFRILNDAYNSYNRIRNENVNIIINKLQKLTLIKKKKNSIRQ